MSEGRSRRIAEDLARARSMSEEDINTDDIPEVFDWSGAVQGKFYRPVKEQVTLRIDADLLAWFRENEEKYQTAINAALREHVDRQRQAKRELTAAEV